MTAMTSPSWARVRGPLAPYAGGFRVELERLGYTPLTAATHVRLMAHLSWWLAREGAEASGLTPAVVDAYFAERRSAGYAGHVTGRALRPLLSYLRRLGVIRNLVRQQTELDRLHDRPPWQVGFVQPAPGRRRCGPKEPKPARTGPAG